MKLGDFEFLPLQILQAPDFCFVFLLFLLFLCLQLLFLRFLLILMFSDHGAPFYLLSLALFCGGKESRRCWFCIGPWRSSMLQAPCHSCSIGL
jgi:hypothetical protein